MKWSVALFFAGLFGALGTVFILLSFGTDYWLLALETCKTELDLDMVGEGVSWCFNDVYSLIDVTTIK